MVKDTKKNRELVSVILKKYPVLERYYYELEECSPRFNNKCGKREKGKGICYLCQNNKIGFSLKQCDLGINCYDYDGTPFEDTKPICPELFQLIKTYPELFDVEGCCDCCGCAGW